MRNRGWPLGGCLKVPPASKFHPWLLGLGLGLALTVGLPLPKPADPAPLVPTWSQGVYLWNSLRLLDPKSQEAELQQLQRQGMTELLVGLSAPQVRAADGSKLALAALLRNAHRRGMRVQLLLGDPSWILPAHRFELLELVTRYRQLPFDGLHLDLEVEQLGWPVPPSRLSQWLDTVVELQQQSPWPVGISSHPRWFEQDGDRGEAPCGPCRLSRLGAISLMIYQRNPQRSAARASAIARRWPQLHFRLAQSVEKNLGAELSWHGSSAAQLQQQVQNWRLELEPHGIGGIYWQDWQDYPKSP